MSTDGQQSVYYTVWTAVIAASGADKNYLIQNNTRVPMIWQIGTSLPAATDYTGKRLPRRNNEPYDFVTPHTIRVPDGETLYVRATSPHFDADSPPAFDYWEADAA